MMSRDRRARRSRCLPLLLMAAAALLAALPGVAAGLPPDRLEALQAEAPTLNPEVLRLGLRAVGCAEERGEGGGRRVTIIDYSRPSTEKRLWVFDLDRDALIYHELVAHGKNTGKNRAVRFSNRRGSRKSSLGLFLTGKTYQGHNGYSLKLHGLEAGINDHALQRTIVMHGAWYVSEEFKRKHGRLGRSWGCPAVTRTVARPLIDEIKGGNYLFIYYPDDHWLSASVYLNGCSAEVSRAVSGEK